MSIAAEKVKIATERFLLVRVNPARAIIPASVGGGIYEITLPFIMNSLELNGVVLTKDMVAPTVNGHWFQDESTKILQVKLAVIPDDTTNILVAFHYMFFTATNYRPISEDPEDGSTTIREWRPLILNYPSILQSFDNIFNGIFTINDTSIEIINTDFSFQQFLGDDDTFFNKTVDIWLCINDVSNIQKIFTGTIKNLAIGGNTVTLNCVDSFNKLKGIASMGDQTNEIYYSTETFPNIDPKFSGFPIPYIVGSKSRYATSVYMAPINVGDPFIYLLNECNEAATTSIDAVSVTTNREWGCCRQKGSVAVQSLGTLTKLSSPATNIWYAKFMSFSNLSVGDYIKFNSGGGDQYALVGYVGDFTSGVDNYNVILIDPSNSISLTSVITGLKSFAVVIYDPTIAKYYYPVIGVDYTLDDSTVTSGGNHYVKFTFANNFEPAWGISPHLDPNRHKVFYRTSNSFVHTHADLSKDICGLVGIPTNSTSFSDVNTALPVNARFSIPNYDEQDYDIYLKYVQDVLSSTLGYLKVNSSFEVEYNLIAAPSSTNIRDSFLMIQDQTGCDIEYQDIATKIIAYNPHNSSAYETSLSPSPSETRESVKARWLAGAENVNRFVHCLETITSRIAAHIGLKSFRFAKYKFQTATEDIDTELGDDIELNNKIVIGNSEIQDVKIITIEKSPKYVSLEASDFKGI